MENHDKSKSANQHLRATTGEFEFYTLPRRRYDFDQELVGVAPRGALFTLFTLLTGDFWDNPMWGTIWVWVAHLTSVLILYFVTKKSEISLS